MNIPTKVVEIPPTYLQSYSGYILELANDIVRRMEWREIVKAGIPTDVIVDIKKLRTVYADEIKAMAEETKKEKKAERKLLKEVMARA